MFPATTLDKSSRQNGHAPGQTPVSSQTPFSTNHGQPEVRGFSPASAGADSPLTLEKESTRRERVAKAKEKRAQDDKDIEAWGSVWKIGRDAGETRYKSKDPLHPPTNPRKSKVPHLALAPEPASPLSAPLRKSTPTRICSELARRSVAAARKADTEGDRHTALRHYAVAAENDSSDPQVYFRMGVLLRQTHGDLRQSLVYLRKAILLRPEQIKYRCELADLYETLGFELNARRQREQIQALQEADAPKRARRFW